MLNILITGVGGQGALLASRLIGQVAIFSGFDVKVSEVHGMAQRGGSVVTFVRFDKEKVYSPLIEFGEADILLSFEPLEAYRAIVYIKSNGLLITNTRETFPMSVVSGEAKYPTDLINKLSEKASDFLAFDATQIAMDSGSAKMINVVLIGALAAKLESKNIFNKESWQNALRTIIPEKLWRINEIAFLKGFKKGGES